MPEDVLTIMLRYALDVPSCWGVLPSCQPIIALPTTPSIPELVRISSSNQGRVWTLQGRENLSRPAMISRLVNLGLLLGHSAGILKLT